MDYKEGHRLEHASDREKFDFELQQAIKKGKRDDPRFTHEHHEFLTRRYTDKITIKTSLST